MTIVRSLGVTTLVALMSAHREAACQCESEFDQTAVETIEAYLRTQAEPKATEPPRSYN
jgi:hypothetical protein